MIVVGCPACGDNVLAPSGVSTEANVRCPLCMEEFPLSAAFSELPPELIVLEQPENADGAFPFDLASSSSDVAIDVDADAPAFQFEEGSAPVRPRVQVRQPASGSKSKNVVFEMLKVVLGGVLGLAIGQILLWRMPGNWPSHQRDPFQFGEKYANVFPVSLLAPQSVRDPGSISEMDDGVTGFDDSAADQVTEGMSSDPDVNTTFPVSPDVGTNTADPANTGSANADVTNTGPSTPVTVPGIRFAPRVTGSQLAQAMGRSETAAANWATADGDRAKELAVLIRSLRDLSHAVTFIQPTRSVPQETVKQLREFLPQFSQPGIREALYQGARPPSADDALAGEVVVGEVTAIALNGELFQTTLKLPSGDNVPIMSVGDPREKFTTGDQILMLAVWVTDPATQLAGYDILDTEVVLFGEFPIRLVSTENQTEGSTLDPPDEEADATSDEPPNPAPPNPEPPKRTVGQVFNLSRSTG